MVEFKELERVFLESVAASARNPQGACDAGSDPQQKGFGEVPHTFGFSDNVCVIDAAEAACLEYEVSGVEELLPKIEFILQQMRQLTDESEEFDVYADRLLADVKSVIARNHD